MSTYEGNPQLNSQRAATRAIDENVPTAPAGYRPRFAGTASLTEQYLDQLTRGGNDPRTGAVYNQAVAASPASDRPASPRTLEGTIARSRTEHPLITTSMYNVDIALQQVKIRRGRARPHLGRRRQRAKELRQHSLAVLETLSASIGPARRRAHGADLHRD